MSKVNAGDESAVPPTETADELSAAPALKLFEVDIESTLYVVAKDEDEAERVAQRAIETEHAAASDMALGATFEAYQVDSERHHLGDWRNSLPYGERSRTCQQILDEWVEWERTRPLTAAELEAAGQLRLIQEA